MKKENTLSKAAYVRENIFWCMLLVLWYYSTLFRSLDGMNEDRSWRIFHIASILSCVLGMCLTWGNRRSYPSLLINVSLPLAVYTAIIYRHIAPVLVWGSIAAAAIFSVYYSALIFRRKIRPGADRSTVIRRRIIKCFFCTRAVGTYCLLVVPIVLAVSSTFGIYIFSPDYKSELRLQAAEEASISASIETLSLLESEKWETLSNEEKLNVLQTVADIEVCDLGLSHGLSVSSGKLRGTVLACYNDRTHMIKIDIEHLESGEPEDLLISLCHEARHAYQHRLCDLYRSLDDEQKKLIIFDKTRLFLEEFTDYKDGINSKEEYYWQQCEWDAREYAVSAAGRYTARIKQYREGAA